MLNKIMRLDYIIDQYGDINEVKVGFAKNEGDIYGNLNITLDHADGDLNALSPNDLKEIATNKIAEGLLEQPEEEPTEE